MVLLLLSLCFFCIFLHYRFNFDVFLFRPERFRHNNDDGNYINKTFFSAYIPRLNQNSIQFNSIFVVAQYSIIISLQSVIVISRRISSSSVHKQESGWIHFLLDRFFFLFKFSNSIDQIFTASDLFFFFHHFVVHHRQNYIHTPI